MTRRTFSGLALLLLGGCVLALGYWAYRNEVNRLRGRLDLQASELDQLRRDLNSERADVEHKAALLNRLEADLDDRMMRERAITEMVDNVLTRRDRAAARRKELAKKLRKPMPEGVRQVLMSLNECLALDGYSMRFSRAVRLEGKELFEPQFLERDVSALTTTHHLPMRMQFELMRDKGMLRLRMFGGFRIQSGKKEPLPETGLVLDLRDVDVHRWERRLPLLMRVTGQHKTPKEAKRELRMDPVTRDSWLRRLDALVTAAAGATRYRVDSFRNLRDGWFRNVLVTGYDKKKRLRMCVEAERMQVVVNEKAGTVELHFRKGVLRRKAGETEIGPLGYRLLLSKLTPKRASELMLGMVRSK